jgi:hypothetical protein
MFWPLFLAGSERLRNNRRMTDAAHNQHSETRRPSDRDGPWLDAFIVLFDHAKRGKNRTGAFGDLAISRAERKRKRKADR